MALSPVHKFYLKTNKHVNMAVDNRFTFFSGMAKKILKLGFVYSRLQDIRNTAKDNWIPFSSLFIVRNEIINYSTTK